MGKDGKKDIPIEKYMHSILYTHQAENELSGIHDYSAVNNFFYAEEVV